MCSISIDVIIFQSIFVELSLVNSVSILIKSFGDILGNTKKVLAILLHQYQYCDINNPCDKHYTKNGVRWDFLGNRRKEQNLLSTYCINVNELIIVITPYHHLKTFLKIFFNFKCVIKNCLVIENRLIHVVSCLKFKMVLFV